jgi:hypothetical protein
MAIRTVFPANPVLQVTHRGKVEHHELPMPGELSLRLEFDAPGTATFQVSDVFCPVELHESTDNRLLSVYLASIAFLPSSHLVGRTMTV